MADVSKRTILVLLVLVVLSSLISTWAFISSVSTPQRVYVSSPRISESTAEVSLRIQPPAVSVASGQVVFNVIPKGG